MTKTTQPKNNGELVSLIAARRSQLASGPAALMLTAAASVVESEGQLPRFELDAYSGGLMYPNLSGIYWDGPVVVNIAGVSAGESIPVHREHDRSRPVGHCAAEMGERIRCEGVFSLDNTDVSEIRTGARNGFPWRASIGLQNMRYQIVDEGQSIEANGATFDGPLLYVISAELAEVSFVTVPGDGNTAPAIAANSHGVRTMNFSQWLVSKGWTESELSDAQLAQLRALYEQDAAAQADADNDDDAADAQAIGDADHDDAAAADDQVDEESHEPLAAAASAGGNASAGSRSHARQQTGSRQSTSRAASQPNNGRARVEAIRRQELAETRRIQRIREVCNEIGNPVVEGTDGATLEAHAIGEGWDVTRTALYATRNSRPAGPAIHSSNPQRRCSLEALQAGIMLRAGRQIDQVLPDNHQIPNWMTLPVNDTRRQQIMDNAQRYRDLEMIDYVAQGLQAMGHQLPANHTGRSGRLATLQAGFSTGSLQNIFTQSIGALALAAYSEVGDFSQGWTTEEPVPNLLETDRVRMGASQDLTHHPTGGEADHVYRSDVNEKVKADRFSRTFEVDENDFINDRFMLLRNTPRDFGRAAARLRPNMVAAVLLANAALSDGTALFHASHSNLLTGSALSNANLRAARSKLAKQKDGDANLNLQATHLIVPTDLGDLAVQCTMSAIITNDSGAGGTNPLRMRNIMPVDEARLANGVVDPLSGSSLAGSATTWYLVSAEGHTIEVQILEGTGGVPIVVVNQLTGGKFGLSITVKHFIGAKALDYRSMVKVTA